LVSLVLFGSSVVGGFSEALSDVDLILVVPDGTSTNEQYRLRLSIEWLEFQHGFRSERGAKPWIDRLAMKVTANNRTFFICSRSELVSGKVRLILGLSRSQAFFVDRAVLPSIIASSVTVWGEDLLSQIPAKPIRRFDVFKSFFGLFSQALFCVAFFPWASDTTEYATGTLKRSIHSCYLIYEGRRRSLEEEINFFKRRFAASRTMKELLALRTEHRRSFGFITRCLPTLIWLYWRTAVDNKFPLSPIDRLGERRVTSRYPELKRLSDGGGR
jgi:predicted nucleotidyltransferase